jgi:hypothetical protein
MEDKLKFLADYLKDNFSYNYDILQTSIDNLVTKISLTDIDVLIEYDYEELQSFIVTTVADPTLIFDNKFFSATQVIDYIITRKYEGEQWKEI